MKKNLRKILSLVLALSMCLALVPASFSFAEDPAYTVNTVLKPYTIDTGKLEEGQTWWGKLATSTVNTAADGDSPVYRPFQGIVAEFVPNVVGNYLSWDSDNEDGTENTDSTANMVQVKFYGIDYDEAADYKVSFEWNNSKLTPCYGETTFFTSSYQPTVASGAPTTSLENAIDYPVNIDARPNDTGSERKGILTAAGYNIKALKTARGNVSSGNTKGIWGLSIPALKASTDNTGVSDGYTGVYFQQGLQTNMNTGNFNVLASGSNLITTYDRTAGTPDKTTPLQLFTLNFALVGSTVQSDITADDIRFYTETGTTALYGGKIEHGDSVRNDIAYVNWAKALTPTALTTVEVKKTSGTGAAKLTSGEVKMKYRATTDDEWGEETTYGISGDGHLTLNNKEVNEGAAGALKLAAGIYSWTVDPKDPKDTEPIDPNDPPELVAHSEEFTITADEVGENKTLTKTLYAKGYSAGEKDYDIYVLDNQSENGMAGLKDAKVRINGADHDVDSTGKYTYSTEATASPIEVNIKCTGYVTKTVHINFTGSAAEDAENKNVDMPSATFGASAASIAYQLEQATTKVAISGISNIVEINGKTEKRPIAGTIVEITPLVGGTVTPWISKHSPAPVTVNSDGLAEFDLPNGDYQYVIKAPGCEPTKPVSLIVRNSANSSGGTVTLGVASDKTNGTMDSGSTIVTGAPTIETSVNPGSKVITKQTGESMPTVKEADTAASKPAGTTAEMSGTGVQTLGGGDNNLNAQKITTDPIYIVTGELSQDKSTMTVKVMLNNVTEAKSGYFGLKYDTNIFSDPVKTDFVWGSGFRYRGGSDQAFNIGNTSVPNPQIGSGYFTFQWESTAALGTTATGDGVELGTFTLNLKSAAQNDPENYFHSEALAIMPFNNTPVVALLDAEDNAYNAEADAANQKLDYEFMKGLYWRTIPSDALAADADYQAYYQNTLDKEKATANGFCQGFYASAHSTADPAAAPTFDIRAQFIFNTWNKVSTHFMIKSNDSNPVDIAGAVVTLYDKTTGDPVATGVSDSEGHAIVIVPAGEYTFDVTHDNYLDYPSQTPGHENDSVDIDTAVDATDGNRKNVVMSSKNGHRVEIKKNVSTGDPHASLTIGNMAYNGVDFKFGFDLETGYVWPNGKLPLATDLIVKIALLNQSEKDSIGDAGNTGFHTIDSSKISLAADGTYTIQGDGIVGEPDSSVSGSTDAGVITIEIPTDKDPEEDQTQYTLTVDNGVGGTVSWNPVTGHSYTDNAPTPVTLTGNSFKDEKVIIETLPAGTLASTTYKFVPTRAYKMTAAGEYEKDAKGKLVPVDNPDSEQQDLINKGEVYIIKEIKYGVDVIAVSTEEKKYGFEYAVPDVSAGKTLVCVYARTKLTDIGDIPDDPEPQPTEEIAMLGVKVGIMGDASVDYFDKDNTHYTGSTADALDGGTAGTGNSASYKVKVDASTPAKVKFTAKQGVDTAGTAVNYIVSQIFVTDPDGNMVLVYDQTGETTGADVTAIKAKGVSITPKAAKHTNAGGTAYGYDEVTVTIAGFAKGEDWNVSATFQNEESRTPDTVLILTEVKDNKGGTILPWGVRNEKVGKLDATYVVTPDAGYQIKSVKVTFSDGTEKELDLTADMTDVTGTNNKSYTFPKLAAGSTPYKIFAEFEQPGIKIEMRILPYPNGTADSDKWTVNNGATITWARYAGGNPDIFPFYPDPDKVNGKEIVAECEVPDGTYKVTVSKAGYLNVVFKEVVVENGALKDTKALTTSGKTLYLFGRKTTDNDTIGKPINLRPGDATLDGERVDERDATLVGAGLRANESTSTATGTFAQVTKKQCDLDNDGQLLAKDLGWVKTYFAQYYETIKYSDFQDGGLVKL